MNFLIGWSHCKSTQVWKIYVVFLKCIENRGKNINIELTVKMVRDGKSTTTKQRKKSSSVSEAEVSKEETVEKDDPYEQNKEFEEAEALKRSSDEDIKLYLQTTDNIRKLLAEIAELKKLDSAEVKEQIEEKKIEACCHVTVLKKLNRLDKFRAKAGRDAVEQSKLQTDKVKLDLQNMLYELSYLKKEISKCLQFTSLDEEIDLVPTEEFLRNAPEAIRRSDVTATDPHQLQLARLEWELEQRKQLANECKQLELEKGKVAEQIKSKEERLEKMLPHLNKLLDVAKPLQEHLGVVVEKTREDHELAPLLPNPLYLLYTKIKAFIQVYNKVVTVEIKGNEEDAKVMKKEDDDFIDSDSEQDSSHENSEKQKRHKRKSSRTIERDDLAKKIITPHPLHVQIIFNLKSDKGVTMILDFYYRIKLHVITVKCQVNTSQSVTGISLNEVLSGDHLLRDLFPNDNGEVSPNPANYYQLLKAGIGAFTALIDEIGHPYQWAQKICGLDFADLKMNHSQPIPNSEICQSNIESVMKMLERRFQNRITLAKQIQEFDKNIVPETPDSFQVPLKLSGMLTTWSQVTWLEYSKIPCVQLMISNEFVTCNDMLYRAVITRNTAKLIAFIAINHNFPEKHSIFSIEVEWDGVCHSSNNEAIRDMEGAVNSDWSSNIKRTDQVWLLSAQMRRLIACFDIYLETNCPEEFPQDKMFFRGISGRNRALPFKYVKAAGGLFTQY